MSIFSAESIAIRIARQSVPVPTVRIRIRPSIFSAESFASRGH